MRRVRGVIRRSSKGLGLSAAFVREMADSRDPAERDAVRRVLLGSPVEAAFSGLMEGRGASGELLRFVAALAKVSAAEASRGAEKLSSLFDRWTLLKEKSEVERKVMSFRGLVVSLVAGVVVGMLASLAPVISGFQISLAATPQAAPAFSPYEGAALLVPSASCLGLFLSPQRPYLNVAVALAAFAGVVYFMGPLASFSLAT